jgi:hypothetical protein
MKKLSILALAWISLALSIAFAGDINVTVNVTGPEVPAEVPAGYAIMKTLVGLGIGIGFIGGLLTLLFGIDFFKTKNPFVAIVMAMIGLAVILFMFTYLWGML